MAVILLYEDSIWISSPFNCLYVGYIKCIAKSNIFFEMFSRLNKYGNPDEIVLLSVYVRMKNTVLEDTPIIYVCMIQSNQILYQMSLQILKGKSQNNSSWYKWTTFKAVSSISS